jgi:signal transduction histidine kinase
MPPAFESGDQRQLGGLGILGMRERLRNVNGRLTIQSGEQGTKLTATVPLAGVATSS